MLLHIEIVAGMTGENQWDVIPPGKRETKAATHKRMVDMNYVHPLENGHGSENQPGPSDDIRYRQWVCWANG